MTVVGAHQHHAEREDSFRHASHGDVPPEAPAVQYSNLARPLRGYHADVCTRDECARLAQGIGLQPTIRSRELQPPRPRALQHLQLVPQGQHFAWSAVRERVDVRAARRNQQERSFKQAHSIRVRADQSYSGSQLWQDHMKSTAGVSVFRQAAS
jgi:hypothetical protein